MKNFNFFFFFLKRNKKYPESPSFTSFDNNPAQTPMTQQIEMYNWLCECIKKVKPNKVSNLIFFSIY